MFTRQDYGLIDQTHFTVIDFTGLHIILKTKSNSHYWCIKCNQGSTWLSYSVEHKHRFKDAWHVQRCKPHNLKESLDVIMAHDRWWISQHPSSR